MDPRCPHHLARQADHRAQAAQRRAVEDDVAAMAAGDADALGHLFDAYYVELVRFAERYVASTADAQDVLHDVFAALWAHFSYYAVDTAQSDVGSTAYDLQQNGIAVHGEPSLSPHVSDVTPEGSASIRDSVDATGWQPVYAATGESAAVSGQASRLLTNSTALYYDNRWVINASVVDRDTTC